MRRIALIFLIASTFAFAQDQQAQIGYKSDPNADRKRQSYSKIFIRSPGCTVPVHKIERAKYYVIDVHNHINDAQGIDDHMDPAKVVQIMDATNVKTVVILTGMWGDKLQKVIDEMVKPYPGRFIVFTQIDWSKIDAPDFSQQMVRQIDDAVSRGARGLKLLKDLGLGVRDKSGKLIAIDDPRLDPIWDECGQLGIPVSIHSANPEAFFLSDRRHQSISSKNSSSIPIGVLRKDYPGIDAAGSAKPRIRQASQDAFCIASYGMARESRLGCIHARQVSERDGRIRRPRSRTRASADALSGIFPEVSRPHHVWHRQRNGRGDVPYIFRGSRLPTIISSHGDTPAKAAG